jgi:hypothetical protein
MERNHRTLAPEVARRTRCDVDAGRDRDHGDRGPRVARLPVLATALGSAPIWPTSPTGAVDLKLLHRLVHEWFAGRPVYRELASAVHPPATYLLLWPLMGWLDVTPARWLWAITTVVALAALIHVKDLLACGLILATLVKPSISVPFLWLVLFAPGSPGPFSLVALGYGALTVIAVSFQDSTPWVLLHEPRGE